MRLPDFFVVGAAKSGTTTLFRNLIRHPAVFIPAVKEPAFFSDYPVQRFRTLDAYASLYSGCPPEIMAGDATPTYLPSRSAAERIHALRPRARIMAILRNPVDRAYSLYWQKRKWFKEDLSFEAALEAEERRIEEGFPFGYRYVRSGLYSEQVLRYLDLFGPDLVRVYLFDDLLADGRGLFRDAFRFLGVDEGFSVVANTAYSPTGPYRNRIVGRLLGGTFPGRSLLRRATPRRVRQIKDALVHRSIERAPAMSPHTRAMLVERFRDDVERLEKILGRDLSHWRRTP